MRVQVNWVFVVLAFLFAPILVGAVLSPLVVAVVVLEPHQGWFAVRSFLQDLWPLGLVTWAVFGLMSLQVLAAEIWQSWQSRSETTSDCPSAVHPLAELRPPSRLSQPPELRRPSHAG